MTAPNMAAIAASLERSMQNCSLNHHRQTTVTGRGGQSSSIDGHLGIGRSSLTSSISDDAQQNQFQPNNNEDTALELNSHVSLPYHWEQCLDLKTGEIYYINWRNGMKAKEDPRTIAEYSGDCYYSEDDNSSYDSEESSTESSPSSSRDRREQQQNQNVADDENNIVKQDHVLVVAGCKSCLMYYMVPKQHEVCPKCTGQLLHFDRSENGSAASP